MKNPWSDLDSERLAWKAFDLAVDAVTSLPWVRDLMGSEIFAETQATPIKARRSVARDKKGLKS